jgi:hypothetical protein
MAQEWSAGLGILMSKFAYNICRRRSAQASVVLPSSCTVQ